MRKSFHNYLHREGHDIFSSIPGLSRQGRDHFKELRTGEARLRRARPEGRLLLLQLPSLLTLLNFPEGTIFNRASTALIIKFKRAFDMQWNLL